MLAEASIEMHFLPENLPPGGPHPCLRFLLMTNMAISPHVTDTGRPGTFECGHSSLFLLKELTLQLGRLA